MQLARVQQVLEGRVNRGVLVHHALSLEDGGHHPGLEVISGSGEVADGDLGVGERALDARLEQRWVQHQFTPPPGWSMAGSTPSERRVSSQSVWGEPPRTAAGARSAKSQAPAASSFSSWPGPHPL